MLAHGRRSDNGDEVGAIGPDEINEEAHAGAGSPERASGLPRNTSRGNRAPGPDQLNDPRFQKRKYPGHKVTGRGNPRGPGAGEKQGYPMQKRPPYYGGGGQNTH